MRRLAALSFAALALLATAGAHAGRSCEAKAPQAHSIARAMTLAERTARHLDASGAQVVAIARVGQNLGEYGQHYSHLGLAYKDAATGRWRVAHKLNHCGTAEGALYRQGLGEFFLDDLYQYEAGIVAFTPEVQKRLLPVLADNRRLARLNTASYSMVAYPWAQTYQQSNQWALETLALSQDEGVTNRPLAQAWLQLRGYQPATLRISAMQRLGASVTATNIAFDDHPGHKRFSGRIETVSADSAFAWLTRSGLGGPLQVVR